MTTLSPSTTIATTKSACIRTCLPADGACVKPLTIIGAYFDKCVIAGRCRRRKKAIGGRVNKEGVRSPVASKWSVSATLVPMSANQYREIAWRSQNQGTKHLTARGVHRIPSFAPLFQTLENKLFICPWSRAVSPCLVFGAPHY